jgi:Xaa-Pro aminopeptidase
VPEDEQTLAEATVTCAHRVYPRGTSPYRFLAACLGDIGAEIVHIEKSKWTCLDLAALESVGQGLRYEDAGQLFLEARSVKSDREISAIRKAAEAVRAGFAQVVRGIDQGLTEVEVKATFDMAAVQYVADNHRGSEVFTESNVLSGSRIKALHRRGSDGTCKGQPVFAYCAANVDGYWAEIARVLLPPAMVTESAKHLETAQAALTRGIDLLRPGMTVRQAAMQIERYLQSAGAGDLLRYGVFRGIGLETSEWPRWPDAGPDVAIEPGMAICAQVYIETGLGIVGRTETVLVDSTAAVNLLPDCG